MKKLTFMAAMAIAAATLTACGGASAPKANVKSDVDSLSYAAGLQLAGQFRDYRVFEQMNVDSACMNDFIKGVIEGFNAGDDKHKTAYQAGLQIGSQLGSQILPNMEHQFFGEDSLKHFTKNNTLAAFISLLTGKDSLMSEQIADSIVSSYQKKQMEEAQRKFDEEKEANKKAGEAFLAENKTKDGVITTESGLQYTVLTQGTGAKPKATDKVKVEYEGRLLDGTVFDASANHGSEAAEFQADQVIPGWTEALQLMPVGSEYELYIPQELAYGERSMGAIKACSALIFKVKLVDIVK